MKIIYNDRAAGRLAALAMLLETLKIYRDLVDTSSFSKAAELNYLTQPAVSHQIKNLETSLGCHLINRVNSDMRLTPAGLVYYRTAKRMLQAYEDMLAQLKSVSGGLSSSVRISATYSLGTYSLQEHLRRFLRRHPTLKISVNYQKAGRIPEDILRGRADLGIIAYPPKRRGIEAIPLFSEKMVLVCHPRHALAAHVRLPLEAIQGQDLVAFDAATPTRAAVDKLLRARGVAVRIALELDNIETIKSAVQAGSGLSILPETTVRNEVKSKKLCVLEFQDAELLRPVAALTKKGGPASPAARAFLEYLVRAGA